MSSKKPITNEKTKPQRVMVIGFMSFLIGFYTMGMSKSDQSVHSFWIHTVKGLRVLAANL